MMTFSYKSDSFVSRDALYLCLSIVIMNEDKGKLYKEFILLWLKIFDILCHDLYTLEIYLKIFEYEKILRNHENDDESTFLYFLK